MATAYGLVSWILIEAGSVLLPTFGAPEKFFRVYVVIVVTGFVLAMVLAWIFEITPEGIKLGHDVDRDTYVAKSANRFNVVIIALLVVALGISITFNVTGMRGDALDLSAATRQAGSRSSIAVLPFTSRSSNTENQFFADGIHDDILTRLAEIESLRVISRTSVNAYRDTTRNLKEIGENLGVSNIVEGAVQRSADDIRVTVQLIDAATDEHIWAETYDGKLTIENVFSVQTEISAAIATALRTALTPAQELRLANIPTDNIEAYAEYVSGRENLLKRNFSTLIAAREQFENAIRLDADYAQAHAALAETLLVTFANHRSIPSDEAFRLAAEHIDAALRIDPLLAQAYAARGLSEMMQWEVTRVGPGNIAAAESFERALALNPSFADAYVWYASLRRTEGDIQTSIDLLTTALTIDPLSRIPYVNLPSLLAMEGQNEKTTELLLRAIDIFPEWSTPYNYLSNHLLKLGRLDEAIAWGRKEAQFSSDPLTGGNLIGIYKDFGDNEAILNFVEAFPTDHPLYPIGRAYYFYIEQDYEATLRAIDELPDDPAFPLQLLYPLVITAAVFNEDYDRAYETIKRGNPNLTSDAEKTVDRFNIVSAVLLAFIEQKRNRPRAAADLLEQAQAVIRSLPRLGMSGHGIQDVHVLVLQGRQDAALEVLAQAINEGFVSSHAFDGWSFDADPIIEPLRNDPRFDVLRQRMADKIKAMQHNVEVAESSADWAALLAKVNAEAG